MKNARLALLLAAMFFAGGPLRADINKPGDLASYREKIDHSIDRGLKFLKDLQIDAAKAKEKNAPGTEGSMSEAIVGETGISSLAVMAFLAKGHTPGHGPYGETINRGLDYILSQPDATGLLVAKSGSGRTNGLMYSHCISTLLLAETSGMVDPRRQRRIDQVLPKALSVILKAQGMKKDAINTGGWRYLPNSPDSDMSLTGWAIMALRAGKLNGAPVPAENIDLAVKYILRCRQAQSGGFAYQPGGGPNPGLTGAGILCLELCGRHGHEAIGPAKQYLLHNQTKGFQSNMLFFYGVYYCGQASFQMGPEYWAKYAPQMYENLLAGQQPDGGWPPADNFGRSFGTAMAILAMTPSYRQLPIYQRDESYEGETKGSKRP